MFLLVEDEHGMVNLVLFSQVYEAHRLLARTEPLLEVHGRLERRDRNINVLVETLHPVGRPGRPAIAPPRHTTLHKRRRARRWMRCGWPLRARITSRKVDVNEVN